MFVNATNVGITQRVVATLVACALVLASIGLYSIAQAANLTTISDTLTDSDVSVVSDHTLVFSTPTGVANGETITVDFSDGPFVIGSVVAADIDVQDDATDLTVAVDCTGAEEVGAAFSGTTLTITFCVGDGAAIAANGTTTIQIGTNAAGGTNQLTNPAAGSHEIVVTAGASDTGRTRVAVIDNVLVTAQVDTVFDFAIDGLATSTAVNGTSTTGSTTPTAIPFGTLVAGEIKSLAQELTVTTNARNGFVVTVESDGDLQSSTGAIIDGFLDGTDVAVPGTPWASPTEDIDNELSWGHWGLISDDADLLTPFTANHFIAASTTAREVFTHDGPADGTTADKGLAQVLYQVEITPLQEAADDYSTILTYIATPTF